MLAIDCSNYSGAIDSNQARALAEAGVKRAIVQLVNPRVLTHRQQFPALIAAGIDCEAYVYLWFDSDIGQRIRWALSELAQRPGVRRVWLDCEDVTGGQTVESVLAGIREAVSIVEGAGYAAGIYTARWWWVAATDDSHEFVRLPLWNAFYDGEPDLDPAGYGGWDIPRMEQYQGDTTLAGVPFVDLDSYEEVDVITHKLSDTERITAGRAIGNGAGLALAGADGRLVDQIIDPDTPSGYVDYRVRVRTQDGG